MIGAVSQSLRALGPLGLGPCALALIATALAACGRAEAGGTETVLAGSATGEVSTLPAIDAAAPADTETATFALG